MGNMARSLFVLMLCISLFVNVSSTNDHYYRCYYTHILGQFVKCVSLEVRHAMGTRGAWAKDFLIALGNPAPSEDTIKLVAAWTRVENTEADFNPLGTTYDNGDNTIFNYANVRNYKTRQAGIDASVKTLNGNHLGYAALLDALQTNDITAALTSIAFDTWGSHTIKVASAYYAGDFTGDPLKSEENYNVSGGTWDSSGGTDKDIPNTNERTRPQNEQVNPNATSGTVTENDIRNVAKIILGIGFIGSGGIVLVIALMQTDAAQNAAGIAAKVATKGMI